MAAVVVDINVDLIDANPRQSARHAAAVDDLAESLREHGLLQPIILRHHPTRDDRYEVVAGRRRLAAARALGWTHIPAVLRVASADEASVLTLVENLQRADLSPREESQALEMLVRERGWSTRQVASAVNRSQSYVSRRLRVFDDPIVGPLVLHDELSLSAAEELLPLSGSRKRRLAVRAVQQQWDRAQVRRAIRDSGVARAPRRPSGLVAHTRAFREALRRAERDRLTESERRELRLAFQELSALAKGPTDQSALVFLPELRPARTRRR